MSPPGKLDRFDSLVPAPRWRNPWQPDGSYDVDEALLVDLLEVAVGTEQRSGIVAGAVDVWAAEELRRAGFHEDEVWPRRTPPRVLPRDVRNFVEGGLPKTLRSQVESRYSSSAARRALPAEAHVMGRAYSKQSDVMIASWPAGVEVLISTKTMLSSFQKNLRNRFEEGYGDAKNLRGRHPMAALGFMFVTSAQIPPAALEFAIDMLRKLTTEPDVYDCACLLVVDGVQNVGEEEAEAPRGPADEPSGLQVEQGSADDEVPETVPTAARWLPVDSRRIRVLGDVVPVDLQPNAFFATLVGAALERMPVAVYPQVRAHIATAARDA